MPFNSSQYPTAPVPIAQGTEPAARWFCAASHAGPSLSQPLSLTCFCSAAGCHPQLAFMGTRGKRTGRRQRKGAAACRQGRGTAGNAARGPAFAAHECGRSQHRLHCYPSGECTALPSRILQGSDPKTSVDSSTQLPCHAVLGLRLVLHACEEVLTFSLLPEVRLSIAFKSESSCVAQHCCHALDSRLLS